MLTGFTTASVSLDEPTLTIGDGINLLRPGTEVSIILVDPDQNFNSAADDDLDVFKDSSIIPTLEIGNPVTLENSFDVQFFSNSGDDLDTGDTSSSSVLDRNSKRLFIDTSTVTIEEFEKISLNLGISASKLNDILIDTSISNTFGTNWLNYDLRSFANDLEIA